MEILLLVLLVIGAAILYLPEILKERALDSPLDTVTDFHRGMNALAISTHNREKEAASGEYYFSISGQSEPEPYFRKSDYGEYPDEHEGDFIPYPRNKAKMQMETRRQRVMVSLWIVALATGILTLIPSVRWIIPLHITVLVLLAGYSMMVILLPYYNKYR